MSLTKIGSIGINTGIAFAGVTTIVTLNTANDALSIGATVNVGSGITLGASGDIFATGVSTFSGNLKVGSGVTISPDGDGFYTGVVTATTFSGALAASSLTGALPAISGANLTNLDASDLASGTVPTARLGSGTASSSTFLRGDSTFQTVVTDLVNDTSPQLGGNLDCNGQNISLDNNNQINLGNDNDLILKVTDTNSTITHNGTGNLFISAEGTDEDLYLTAADDLFLRVQGSDNGIKVIRDGAVELYYNNVKHFETSSGGCTSNHAGANTFVIGSSDANGAYFVLDGDSNGDGTGADYSGITHQTDGNLHIYQDNPNANGQINFSTGGSQRYSMQSDKFRASNDNACTLGTDGLAWSNVFTKGNYVVKGSGGTGVDFAHSASAGTAANILDDYEEGTWTARFYPNSSGFSSQNYDLDTASYTKTGDVVYWAFRIRISSFSGGGGNLEISGLPYTVRSGQPQTTCSLHGSNWANNTPKNIVYNSGSTRMSLYYEAGTANSASPTNPSPLSSLQNNSYLIGQGFYFI